MVLNKVKGVTGSSDPVVFTLREFLQHLCRILYISRNILPGDDWAEIHDIGLRLLLKSTSALLCVVDGVDLVHNSKLHALVEQHKEHLLANETVQVYLGAAYFDVLHMEAFGVSKAPVSLASTRILWRLLEQHAHVPNFVLIRVPEDRSAKAQHFSGKQDHQYMCSVLEWENFFLQGVLIHAKSFLDCQYTFKCV
jgi:hypothetical protein